MKNIFIAAGAYAAALIGAGFASGQEIVSFFVRYGKYSILGVAASAVIFGVFAGAVIDECVERRTASYKEYLDGFMGRNIRKAVECMTLFFAAAVFCVMAACCGEMGYMLFGIKNIYGALVICVLCGIIMMYKTDDVLTLNALIGGIIIVSIITCCIYLLRYREHQAFAAGGKMIVSSISYSGYNLLTAGLILSQLASRIKNRKDAWLVGFAAAFSMFVIMALMWGLLSIYYGKIPLGEIPMLTLALRENKYIAAVYSVILFLAVFSTALSNGISAVNIIKNKIGKRWAVILVAAVGFCFSGTGFSVLIDKVYRACGYVGVLFLMYIIRHYKTFLKNVKNKEKRRKIK